jgi:hypothetical protein
MIGVIQDVRALRMLPKPLMKPRVTQDCRTSDDDDDDDDLICQ